MSRNFTNFTILNPLVKIKASAHFESIYLLYISLCGHNNQKLQIFLLRANYVICEYFFLQ